MFIVIAHTTRSLSSAAHKVIMLLLSLRHGKQTELVTMLWLPFCLAKGRGKEGGGGLAGVGFA